MVPTDRQYIGTLRFAWWWLMWVVWLVVGFLPFRQSATGARQLPKQGPYLVLPNHTSMFDPFWVAWHMRRPAGYMASAQIFRLPVLGWLVTSLGAFPKVKFMKDRGAMARVQELYDNGQTIMIFPEGERSWDGRTTPVLPGIGRLIKRLNARVVFCQQTTAHLFHPRWADYPRWVPIRIVFSEPVTFPTEATPEEIALEVGRRIRIRPDADIDGPTFGWRMAWGLRDYVWACPVCKVPNALRPDPLQGNVVSCKSCNSRWRVTTSSRLLPRSPGAPELSVHQAYDIVREHFGSPPVIDRKRFEADGIILESASAAIGRILKDKGAKARLVLQGRLVLVRTGLRLYRGSERLWMLDFDDVLAVSMEFQNRLQVRTADALYQLDSQVQSRIQWNDFIRPWWSLQTTGEVDGWRPK